MGDTLIRYLHDSYKSLIDIEDFLDANKIKKIEWKSVNQTQMLPLFDAMYKKAENGDIKAIFTSLIWLKKKGYTGLLQSADVTAMYNATYFKKALEKGRIKSNDESKALRKEFLDVFSEELNHAKTI
jgi:glycine cleavage system protein P-like pyridoxal-binding family